jgi:adenosylmethionine-8-amino-7-oxononanoate aminotransferase
MIENTHEKQLKQLSDCASIEKRRYCGTIAAFDLKINSTYGSNASIELRQRFLKKGLLVRPLGNSLYLLPPYCISESDLNNAYHIILHELEEVLA